VFCHLDDAATMKWFGRRKSATVDQSRQGSARQPQDVTRILSARNSHRL
jgi:hypothetical protein